MESTCYHCSSNKGLTTRMEVDDLKAKRFARTQDPLALMETSNNPYTFPVLHQDQPSFNQKYMQQPILNPEDITDPTPAMNMALTLMAKAFKLNYSTPTNNDQRISSNPRNRQIAQPGMNMGQDSQLQMVGVQNIRNQVAQNAIQNTIIQNVGNQNGQIVVPGTNQNPNGNGNLVAARAEGNATRYNGNQIRCYNCRGLGHFARNCTVRPRRRDGAYLQTQLLIAQKEEAGIQLQAEEFNLMAAAADLDEIEEVIANYGSAENDNNVISEVSSMEQSGGIVEQHPANVEETHVLYDSLYNNLTIEVEKINTVNHKLSETNAKLTTELARYKNQEKCFEISQEKYDKLERCYQKSVYQEQCLYKRINALYLCFGKQIMTLNEGISDLNKQLSVEKSTVSSFLKEKKKLKYDFKIREDELLDKQIQLEKKIKELDNILVKMGQSIQTIHTLSPKPDLFYHTEQKMTLGYQNPFYLKQAQQKQQSLYHGKVLFEKHDPPVVHDSEETLQLAQETRQKMKQLNKEIKPANYTKINHLSGVFVSQMAKLREELYFLNTSKTANVSKPISISNEEFSDDTTPNEIFPIVNQVDVGVQNFEIQFLKEAAKFVGDFKSIAKEADESLAKHKALKLEIEHLLRAVIKRLQAQLEELKGTSKDTSCVSDTLNLLSQKLENENVELEFQLKAQLFNTVYDQKDTSRGTSANTKFAKQSILGKPPKVGESHALSKPVTSNSIPTPQGSKVVKNDKEAAKFVGDFKSLAKEDDESLAKHKALELEIERLLRAVVSQDIMSVVQKESVVDTSNLQIELERMKERFENCIIKKENKYAQLWKD
nr:hypothetical protein [Tanacetum cinerariifolium]